MSDLTPKQIETLETARATIRDAQATILSLRSTQDDLVEALELATHELTAIRACDGAPQRIHWDRGGGDAD